MASLPRISPFRIGARRYCCTRLALVAVTGWAALVLARAAPASQTTLDGVPVPTLTPYSTPTRTATFTVAATFTPTPTAEAGCQWTTFRLASGDHASWTRIDASRPDPVWPPPGGSGPVDVTGDGHLTILVEGSSDTQADIPAFETPPGIAWSRVLQRETNGAWTIENLATNNQSTIDYRAIRLPTAPQYVVPWIETQAHEGCGAAGLESDLAACDPDIVVLVPESNDAMWPLLYPDQLSRSPQDLVDSLIRQCDIVFANNPDRSCFVPTMGMAPYVATWPAAHAWIADANALIRQTFPNTRVIDFATASSNALDYYHSPWGYEGNISHSNQRVLDVRAGRVLAAVMQSVFTTTAPVLQAEARLWNGVAGLSVIGVRWDTSSLPDDTDVRTAVVEVRSTYRGAPGTATEARSIGWQWANREADDGWQADDWPAALSPTAYAGAPEIGASEERGMPWSFVLSDPRMVSLTGYTGLYGFVTPSTLPTNDAYFSYDVMSYDASFGPEQVCVGVLGTNAGTPCPLGNECRDGAICLTGRACVGGSNAGASCPLGNECAGGGACLASDGAPKLHVYHCAPPPTATATITPTDTVTPTAAGTTPAGTATSSASPPSATATSPPKACVGDCDGSGGVTIDELILGVDIALGSVAVTSCPAFDPGDGAVHVTELVTAVGNALHGCRLVPGNRPRRPSA